MIPLIYGIYLTFTNWNGLSPNYDLVGFSNYAAIFTDKTFLSSLWKTFVYVFFVVVFSNVLGLALALLLTYGIKLQGLFRTCFFRRKYDRRCRNGLHLELHLLLSH